MKYIKTCRLVVITSARNFMYWKQRRLSMKRPWVTWQAHIQSACIALLLVYRVTASDVPDWRDVVRPEDLAKGWEYQGCYM
jgi:hypothetical protein